MRLKCSFDKHDASFSRSFLLSSICTWLETMNLNVFIILPLSTQTYIHSDRTFSAQVDAIMAIKFEYGVKKNWMGDPCFPTIYAWNGVKCSNTGGNTTRIKSL